MTTSIMDMIVMARLGVDESWLTDGKLPLNPAEFMGSVRTQKAHDSRPMSRERLAQQKPMSYYIALEQDRQHMASSTKVICTVHSS